MEGCCLPDKRQASLALLRLTSGCLYELVRVLGEWLPSGSVWHRLSPVKVLRVAVLGVYYKVGPLLFGPFIVMTYSQAGILVRRRVEDCPGVFRITISLSDDDGIGSSYCCRRLLPMFTAPTCKRRGQIRTVTATGIGTHWQLQART